MFADFAFNGLVALFFGLVCAGEVGDCFRAYQHPLLSGNRSDLAVRLLSPLAAGAMCLWAVYRMPF